MDFLVEILLEVLFAVLGEIFSGTIGTGVSTIFGLRMPVAVKVLLYFLAGSVLCGLSLIFFPHAHVHLEDTRLAVLIGTPLASGMIIGFYTAWRGNKKRTAPSEVFSLPGFFYGLLFASPLATGRYLWAH